MSDSIVPQNESIEPIEWIGINEEVRRILRLGEEALMTNRKGLERVFEIGATMEGLRLEAMRQSHSNNPTGIRYNEVWDKLATPLPLARQLNTTDRNQYIECYQKRELIEAWWSELSQQQRDRWNHPDTILDKFYKDFPEYNTKKRRTTKPAEPKQTLRETNVQLQNELDEAKRKIRQLEKDNEGPLLTRSASPEEIHQILSEYFNPTKYKAYLGIALGKQSSTAPQLRIKKSK